MAAPANFGHAETLNLGELLYTELYQQLEQRRAKLQQAAAHRQTARVVRLLEEVDSALNRMEDHTFGICEQCHQSVETDRLIADPLVRFCIGHLPPAEQQRLEDDLELAARLQARLLPKQDLVCDGWRVAYHYKPAGLVSGDYVDLIAGPDNVLYFALGDVSGKGVAASLLMSNLNAMFRTLAPLGIPLDEIMCHANRVFCESTLPTQYATLVAGKATPDGAVELVNAGHPEPLVVSMDGVRKIDSGGLPIGLFRDEPLTSVNLQLHPGEVLVLYSDGISESRNAHDQDYGAARLSEVVRRCTAQAPKDSVAACIADLIAFSGNAPAVDDQTLMVLQRVE